MYFYDINIKLFRFVKQKRLKKKSGLPTAQREEFWNGERSVCGLSTGVFKAGKFEKEILLQFPQNEMYLYDIDIKLFRIV